MTISKTRRPYELLIRWASAGLAGAHVQFIEELIEDGTVLSAKVCDAMPVSMAGEAGFPLEEVLALAQADALSTASALLTEVATLRESLAAAEARAAKANDTVAALREAHQLAQRPRTTAIVR